jgi:hypothetical protein
MAFRLRKKTREWFSDLERRKEFALDFDMYYLCLMAGLATGRKMSLANEQEETTELVSNFPGVYREKGRLIVALFLSRELKAMGVETHERAALNRSIAKLVDPEVAHLSDGGVKEMNKYSYGGFDVLTEWFGEKPHTMETFLPLYKGHLDDALVPSS